MLDVDCWSTVAELCSVIDHSRRPDARAADAFGNMRLSVPNVVSEFGKLFADVAAKNARPKR